MSNKTLYQQALEIYQAQQTLNSYLIEQNNVWLNWYNGLTSAEQYHLAQVAAIVSKLVNEVIRGFTEFLVSEDFVPELASGVQNKFSPSPFIEAIGIESTDNEYRDQSDERGINTEAFVDTDTDVMPGDGYIENDRNLLETALDISIHQQFSKEYSLELWFEDLTSEEQKILQDSTETLLDLLPQVIGNYVTAFQLLFQHIGQDGLQKMAPIQQLWTR